MLNDVISYAFPLLELACGIAIVIRFRGSPGAVLGGIAFGTWVATNITLRVLGALDVDWWEYDLWFTLLNLAAFGCLLAALITGRVYSQSGSSTGAGSEEGEGESKPLAGRGARLGAILIDMIVSLLAMAPGMVAMFTLEGDPDIPIPAVLLLLIGTLGLMIYQVVLLTSAGQTIGKRVVGIRIVRYGDQSNPGFLRVVVLRGFVPGIIRAIPYLGAIFALVDILFIFGDERRCVHDLLAGTQVVTA